MILCVLLSGDALPMLMSCNMFSFIFDFLHPIYIFVVTFFFFFCNMVDTGKVDMVMNVVERPSGGFSAGGGISSG
jgi:hypothetical protein